MPTPGNRPSLRRVALGHARVDVVHQLAEARVLAVAWLRQVDPDLAHDAAGIGGEHQDAVAHQDRLLDVVGNHQDRFDLHATFAPEVEQVGAQGLGGQHVQRREGLVHQEDVRVDHQGAGQADTLTHAAGELLGIGVLETVEADQVDGRERPLSAYLSRRAFGLQPELYVLLHSQPWEQREALEHHGDRHLAATVGVLGEVHLALGGGDQAGDGAQQGRLARARAAEQAHNLVLAQSQVDLVQHQEVAVAGLAVEVAEVLDLHQGTALRKGGHGKASSSPGAGGARRTCTSVARARGSAG